MLGWMSDDEAVKVIRGLPLFSLLFSVGLLLIFAFLFCPSGHYFKTFEANLRACHDVNKIIEQSVHLSTFSDNTNV